MLVLDTDHVTEYEKGTSVEAVRLKDRLRWSSETFATTIVTVDEIMRGWLAAIHRLPDPRSQIRPYEKLRNILRFFATWNVLDWDDAAVRQFEIVKASKVRVGTMDLKIGSIALASNATLLTRNMNDFRRIPNLRCEDWLS